MRIIKRDASDTASPSKRILAMLGPSVLKNMIWQINRFCVIRFMICLFLFEPGNSMDPGEGFGYDFDIAQEAEDPVLEDCEPLPRARRRRGRHARRRKTVATPRKNRPFRDVRTLSLECCENKTSLESIGRDIIEGIRREFDKILYEAQNNYLISLIDITPQRGKPTRILYNVRDGSGLRKVPVCKTAFLKLFGIGNKRVSILISKLQPYTGQVQEDQRQLFSRNQKRLPTALKVEVGTVVFSLFKARA